MSFKSLVKLCTILCVTLVVSQASLGASGCANSLSERITKKYNSEDAIKFNFTRQQLSELKKAYHGLSVPGFVADISLGKDVPVNEMLAVSKQFVEHSQDGLAVFIPNTPVYHLASEFKPYVAEGRLSELKNNPEGLALSTWFMHPELSKAAASGAPVISDLESKGVSYLASMLDLNQSHVPHLKELRRLSLSHLHRVYGVDTTDNVDLYFHFPYSPKTVTLHLHIRVNQKIYDLERAKSYTLDNVIRLLEAGGKIEDLILSRQQYLGGLYTNHGTAEDLVKESGIGIAEEAINPFID